MQIEHFKTHGYLVMKNLFDKASLNNWQEQLWHNWDQTSKHLRPSPKTTAVFIVMSTSPRIGILATPDLARHCGTIRRQRVYLWPWNTQNKMA